jgi:DNA-binding transcriptional ArsR family regulator
MAEPALHGHPAPRVGAGQLALSTTLICKPPLAYSGLMVDVFRALDDETRRLVLDELSVRDGQTLFEICSTLTTRHGLSLTRQAISQHLGVLESAGLVVTERSGRSKFHYFSPEPLAEITARWPTRKRTKQ